MTAPADDFRRALVRAAWLLMACSVTACSKKESNPPAEPRGPTPVAQSPDLPKDEDSFEPPTGKAQRVELTSNPAVKSNNAWRQVLPLDPEITRFSLVIRRTAANLSSDPAPFFVIDQGVFLTPDDNGSVFLDPALPVGTEIVTPAYDRVSDGEVEAAYEAAGIPVAPFEVVAYLVWHTDDGITPEGGYEDIDDIELADTAMREIARNVAYLSVLDETCTGFAIAPDLLITNHHCISAALRRTQPLCRQISITFQYFSNPITAPPIPADCVELAAKDADLDYALIRFKTRQAQSVIKGLIPADPKAIGSGELQVIHHPYFLTAQVSHCPAPPAEISLSQPGADSLKSHRKTCGAASVPFYEPTQVDVQNAFSYECDTYSGSSGAPVIHQGKVIGLHFSADYRYFDKRTNDWPANETCLRAHLKLGNWARNICVVLQHVRSKGVANVPICSK